MFSQQTFMCAQMGKHLRKHFSATALPCLRGPLHERIATITMLHVMFMPRNKGTRTLVRAITALSIRGKFLSQLKKLATCSKPPARPYFMHILLVDFVYILQ